MVGNLEDYTGAWIKYEDFGRIEIGRIKRIGRATIQAVFKCDEKWNDFQNYTAESCSPDDVTFLNEDLFTNEKQPVELKDKLEITEYLLSLRLENKTFFYYLDGQVYETDKMLNQSELQQMINHTEDETKPIINDFGSFCYQYLCDDYDFEPVYGRENFLKVFTPEEYEFFAFDVEKDSLAEKFQRKNQLLETIFERRLKYVSNLDGVESNSPNIYLQNPVTKEVFEITKIKNGEMMKPVFLEQYKYKRTANKSKGEKAGSGFLPYIRATEQGFELE